MAAAVRPAWSLGCWRQPHQAVIVLPARGSLYMLSIAAMTAREASMATLTVRNLEADIVRRLRVQAAEHGRSAEAEHREILRVALAGGGQQTARNLAAERLAEFRRRTAGRGS